jgi:hypothetical protein
VANIGGKVHKPQSMTIAHESEFVVITGEGLKIVLQYQDAIQLAANISHHAKVAKRAAGDVSKIQYVHGDLRSAEENDKHVRTHI